MAFGIDDVVAELRRRNLTIACAESLTGGALASAFVEVPGVSDVLRGGVVSYATDVKASVLGVSRQQLEKTGPVSSEVALQMARGACSVLGATIGISTTGVAGPGPTDGHPAGTVWIAISGEIGEETRLVRLSGDRSHVRNGAVKAAIDLVGKSLWGDLPPSVS